MNSALQYETAAYLHKEFNLGGRKNVLFYRKEFFKTSIHNEHINALSWDSVNLLPYFKTSLRPVLWINFFVYIVRFIWVFLQHRSSGNLIIGNYTHHGNRAIANLFDSRWKRIFVLDEGSSTIKIWHHRSDAARRNGRLSLVNRVFRTGHPERQLTFYSNFELPPNGADVYARVDQNVLRQNVVFDLRNDLVLFIGTYFVEAGIISQEYFRTLLEKIVHSNPGKKVTYMAHPQETVVLALDANQWPGFTVVRLNTAIEKHMAEMKQVPAIIASCTSTAYLNSARLFGSSVSYQTYVLDQQQVSTKEKAADLKRVYEAIAEQMKDLNMTMIEV